MYIKLIESLGYSKVDDFYYYPDNSEIFTSIYRRMNEVLLVDYNICDLNSNKLFNYELYTQMQNDYMNRYDRCFRLLYNSDTFESELNDLLSPSQLEFKKENYADRNISSPDNTAIESEFETRWQEVYGLDALQFVHKEYGLIDVKQNQYFYDFVVETTDGFIGVEENGVSYHHPQIIKNTLYKKQLDKQNTFIRSTGKLFRWSSIDCQNTQRVNEEIKSFFKDRSNFISKGLSVGQRSVELYSHQKDTLLKIQQNRAVGKQAFLVVFPTAAGKSKIIEEDLKSLLIENPTMRICIASPTVAISEDWFSRIKNLSESLEIKPKIGPDHFSQIVIGTYHVLYGNINKLDRNHFDYIVVDEAHHAVAPMLKRALNYFTPKFLIGLTATPFRNDQAKIEEIFGTYQVQLTIEEAMSKNIIVPARAYRLVTNVDLKEVRFNGKQFINADLERTIRVNSRNELIAQVIVQYFNHGKAKELQGVIFCVNIKHTEEVASILNRHGISAVALNSSRNTDGYLEDFKNKRVRFLCSCSMISEGWDSPQTSIVIMARPTLSKTLYLQQLGRGFRKFPGKEFLYVIDVVDQYGSLAIPWTLNSIFSNPYYVPFGDVTRRYQVGEIISIYGINEQIQKIDEIRMDTFESKYGDYLSIEQAARELYIGTSSLGSWIKSGKVQCDLEIPFGSRKIQYFTKENVEVIREKFKLGTHNQDTLRKDFIEFIRENQYTFSFKMVFMLSLLKLADRNGEVDLDALRTLYVSFYKDRLSQNLKVDRPGCIYTNDYLDDKNGVNRSILTNPFEKFERKRFVFYSKDLARISFNTRLWEDLTYEDFIEIEETLIQNLTDYYENLDGLQKINYLRRKP